MKQDSMRNAKDLSSCPVVLQPLCLAIYRLALEHLVPRTGPCGPGYLSECPHSERDSVADPAGWVSRPTEHTIPLCDFWNSAPPPCGAGGLGTANMAVFHLVSERSDR